MSVGGLVKKKRGRKEESWGREKRKGSLGGELGFVASRVSNYGVDGVYKIHLLF